MPTALLALIAALGGGLLLGRNMSGVPDLVDDEVSVGFAHDMTSHHAQAVRMSRAVHRRSPDPDVNYLAFDMLSTQQGQIGLMSGWLSLSGQSAGSTEPEMAWMGQRHEGPMPGMATDAEVQALESLPIAQMTEQFLRLMIRHHRGALPMTKYAVEHAGNADVALLADGMNKSQASEVELMQTMLAERGWAREPEQPVAGHGSTHTTSP